MKKIIFIASVFVPITIHAQYFQHIYGSPHNEENQWGMNTVQMGEGFIISGLAYNFTTGGQRLEISRANQSGDIPGAPYFNNAYRLRTNTNVALNATDAKAIEISSGIIGVAGTWHDPATPGIRNI